LAAERRRLKVLYMSGVATAAGLAGEIRQTGGAFLPKPFTLRLLAQRIREVLDG
jgi:DNA-binding NtrC family response regulator